MSTIPSTGHVLSLRSEIDRASRILFEPRSIIEVRVPKAGAAGTVSGYFDDHTKLLDAVCDAAKYGAPGIYWTINPCEPLLLSGAPNLLRENIREATKDDEILRRLYLPVDIDPVRPTGVSASEEEHSLALNLGQQIARDRETEWGEPLIADSGNGAHLIWAIDLPNDPESLALIKAVLGRLDRDYSDSRVKIDTGCHNAARVMKIYGTWARKGEPLPDRPHRLSRIVDEPLCIGVILKEALDDFVSQTKAQTSFFPGVPLVNQGQGSSTAFDMRGYLAAYRWGYQAKRWTSVPGGEVFELEACPFNSEHKHGSAACFLENGVPGFHCFHNGCAGKDIKELFRNFPPDPRRATDTSTKKGALPERFSGEELLESNISEPVPIIERLFFPGVVMIAGRPKVCKTWFGMQTAVALVTGQKLTGHFSVKAKNRVLYLALEDSRPRTKSRLKTLLRNATPAALCDLHFVYELPGGIAQLEELLTDNPVDVVIVDTLLAATKNLKRSGEVLHDDYARVNAFRQVAQKHGVTVILIYHTKKPVKGPAVDDIDSVIGTTGITAAIDCLLHLRLGKTKDSRLISTTGRDVENEIYEFRFDVSAGGFVFLREGDNVDQSDARKYILGLLGQCGPGESMTPKQIAEKLGKSSDSVQHLLRKLLDSGAIQKSTTGCYSIASDQSDWLAQLDWPEL